MSSRDEEQFFEQALFQVLGLSPEVQQMHFTSGGCINNAVQLITNHGDFFIKWNEDSSLEGMFAAEAEGLALLHGASPLYVPHIHGHGQVAQRQFLLLEFVASRYQEANYWEMMGQGLAALHQNNAKQFGLEYNNYIGRLPQKNDPRANWLEFFIEHRLRVQAGLALYNHQVGPDFMQQMEALYQKLPDLLPEETPSLLHGDLWSGNVMVDHRGLPCLIDPAVYYGNREIELAFTQLFGGFDPAFYQAYQEALPLLPGFQERVDLYNLYPLLVHVNLFGASYLGGVQRILHRFVK
ncbi:MAG TPA: ketosamine-3-kinase [Cytophagales bacterium]|nr:ketosamine-3-kinase [Cytophagales bacterium]HAP61845.1 ketosamine-3-kinase [Cytophagales bacterium]